jgi:cobalt-zinc-cadmium efflux system outer membrane protein
MKRFLTILLISCAPLLCSAANSLEPTTISLPQTLNVESAITYAWYNHPTMAKAQHTVAARHGVRRQSGLWPRPELTVANKEKPVETETSVSLSQTLELGGKRSGRIAKADAELFLAESELAQSWSEVRADVRQAFARLAYARQALALAEQLSAIDQEQVAMADSLLKAGKLSDLDTISVKEKAVVTEADLAIAKARLNDAERQVTVTLGLEKTPPGLKIEADAIDLPAKPGTFLQTLENALQNNTILKTARAKTAVRRTEQRLARSARWMNLKLGASYSDIAHAAGAAGTGTATGVRIGIDLPLWDRAQGTVAAANADLLASEANVAASSLITQAAISRILSTCLTWQVQEASLREKSLPLAQQRSQLIADAVKSGKRSLRDALTVDRELIFVKRQHLQAELMTAVSIIELQQLSSAATPPVAP